MKWFIITSIFFCFTQVLAQDSSKTKIDDTVGVYLAPIKVFSVRIVPSASGNYRNLQIIYTNTSMKKITGIKFKWKGIDAFGDTADMGDIIKGYGSGFTDTPIKPHKHDIATWNILSDNVKKILYACPIEVAFEDGTKWKLM